MFAEYVTFVPMLAGFGLEIRLHVGVIIGFTMIETVAVVEQLGLAAVTVYTPVPSDAFGTQLFMPPFHTYKAALPVAQSIKLSPWHMVFVLGVRLMLTVGGVITLRVAVAVVLHPAAEVPVTVYVLLVRGAKGTQFVTPPVHTIFGAPLAQSVALAVPQTLADAGVVLTESMGCAVSVVLTEAVSVQPWLSVKVT